MMQDQEKMEAAEAKKLQDYLIQDLAASKIQLNESRRFSGRLLLLVILAIVLVIVSVGGFAATIYFITKEQTTQIQAIFGGDWDMKKEATDHIYQDSGSGNLENSVITYNRNSNGNNNTTTIHSK